VSVLGWLREKLTRRRLPPLEHSPPAPARDVIHWRPGAVGGVMCGAPEWRLWTIEAESATCPRCVALRQGVEMRRHISER